MSFLNFMLKEYLNRIQYKGITDSSKNVLFEIHRNHLLNIPFENLDIHRRKKLILDKEHLFEKIIKNTRGGYCYELNGMLCLLLREIGFNVKMLSAQVNTEEGKWSPEFSHLALLVSADDNRVYLTDVGFGDNFFEPVLFETNLIQKDKAGYFRIIKNDPEYYVLQNSADGIEFKDGYRFTLAERSWKDFEKMNEFQQTSGDSHFTKNRICSKATETGRISLSDNKMTVTENGKKKVTEFSPAEDFMKLLSEHFQITL